MGVRLRNRLSGVKSQVLVLSAILCLTYGLHIGITTIGNDDLSHIAVASYSYLAVNAANIALGLLGGPLLEVIGPKWAGIVTSPAAFLYVGAMFINRYWVHGWAILTAAVLVGLGMSLIGGVQACFCLAYPAEDQRKGWYLGLTHGLQAFSGIFVGALVLARNYTSSTNVLSVPSYAIFMSLAFVGILLSWLLVHAPQVVRPDGSRLCIQPIKGWMAETKEYYKALLCPQLLLLLPFFLVNQWHSQYQFNGGNGYRYNIRTRGLNLLLYRVGSTLAAGVAGKLLDAQRWSLRVRGLGAALALFGLFGISWSLGLYFQWYHPQSPMAPSLDLHDARYRQMWPIFILWGIIDIFNNMLALWLIGCFTTEYNKVSQWAGWFGVFQSAGAVIAWYIDAIGTDYRIQSVINIAVMVVALGFLGVTIACLPTTIPYPHDWDTMTDKDLDLSFGDDKAICTKVVVTFHTTGSKALVGSIANV